MSFYFRVVMRLGSMVPFSQELNELQEEVKPLWKMPSCPRDFKRTSVEILFREAEFRLDWCSFRLVSCGRLNRAATRETSFIVINVIFPRGISFVCLWRENWLPTAILLLIIYSLMLFVFHKIMQTQLHTNGIITSILPRHISNIIIFSIIQISRHVISMQSCRHRIFLGYCQSSGSFLIYGIQLVPQSHLNQTISAILRKMPIAQITTALPFCDTSLYDTLISCDKGIIFAAGRRSTESAARERSKGSQRERRGFTLVRHLRAHGVAVGPFDES